MSRAALVKLSALAEVIPGLFSRTKLPEARHGGYLLPRLRDLEQAGLNNDGRILTWEDAAADGMPRVVVGAGEVEKYEIQRDDVLVVARGSRYAAFLVQADPPSGFAGVLASASFLIVRAGEPATLKQVGISGAGNDRPALARWLWRVLASAVAGRRLFSRAGGGVGLVRVAALRSLSLRLPSDGVESGENLFAVTEKTAAAHAALAVAVGRLRENLAADSLAGGESHDAPAVVRLSLPWDMAQHEVATGLAVRRQEWQQRLIDVIRPFARMDEIQNIGSHVLSLAWLAEVLQKGTILGERLPERETPEGFRDILHDRDAGDAIRRIFDQLARTKGGALNEALSRFRFDDQGLGGGRRKFRLRALLETLDAWIDEELRSPGNAFRAGDFFDLALSALEQLSGRTHSLHHTPPALSWIVASLLEPDVTTGREEALFDPCAGMGGILAKVADAAVGFEADRLMAALAVLRSTLERDHPAQVADRSEVFRRKPDQHYLRIGSDFCSAHRRDAFDAASEPFRHDFPQAPADYAGAWKGIHWVASALADSGRAVLVIPQTALSGGGADAWIRRGFLEGLETRNLIKAAVLMPALYSGTTMKPVVLVMERSARSDGKILLIDAADTQPTLGADGKWGRTIGWELAGILESWLAKGIPEMRNPPQLGGDGAILRARVIDAHALRANRFSLAFSRHLPTSGDDPEEDALRPALREALEEVARQAGEARELDAQLIREFDVPED